MKSPPSPGAEMGRHDFQSCFKGGCSLFGPTESRALPGLGTGLIHCHPQSIARKSSLTSATLSQLRQPLSEPSLQTLS